MTTFLLAIGLIALCVVGLGVRIFFRKNGKFPEKEIEKNAQMRKRGIICPKEEECKLRKEVSKDNNYEYCSHCRKAQRR